MPRAPGSTCAVLVPTGKIALGKLAQALVHGAKLLEVDGNFDDCLTPRPRPVRELPGDAGQQRQPGPHRGPEDGGLRGVRRARRAARRALPSGRQRRQHHRVLARLLRARRRGRPRQPAAAHARLPGGRRSADRARRAGGRRPRPSRRPSASATRRPGSRRIAARDESGGAIQAVSDREILAAYKLLATREGVFVEPSSAASVAGFLNAHRDGLVAPGERVVCTVTGHGLKDPDWAISRRRQADPGAAGRPGRRGQAGSGVAAWRRRCWRPRRSGCTCRRPAPTWVPASTRSVSPSGCTTSSSLRISQRTGAADRGLRRRARPTRPTSSCRVRGPRSTPSASSRPGSNSRYTARIPHSRGLGSSAAAICAGVTGALALAGVRDRALALRIANSIEGHPDNVAAALYGGLTIAWLDGDGSAAAVRLEPAPGLVPVAFIPQSAHVDRRSRAARCRRRVSHADAARNAGRAALLVAALTAAPRELMAATEDRLHQPYRLPALAEGRGADRAPAGRRRAGRAVRLRSDRPCAVPRQRRVSRCSRLEHRRIRTVRTEH